MAAATLRLADDQYVTGELKDSPRPDVVCWQGAEFTAPFEFALGQASAVQFPPSAKRPKPAGEFCFELSGGDLLFGSLVALSAEEALLDVPHFGPVHVRRADLRRMLLLARRRRAYLPGAERFVRVGRSPGQRCLAARGRPPGNGPGSASLAADLRLPARACVEFEISWSAKPDFKFALGAGGQADEPMRFGSRCGTATWW